MAGYVSATKRECVASRHWHALPCSQLCGGLSAKRCAQAWAVVERYAAPVLRAVPFLNVPIRFVSRWFMPPGVVVALSHARMHMHGRHKYFVRSTLGQATPTRAVFCYNFALHLATCGVLSVLSVVLPETSSSARALFARQAYRSPDL